MDLLTKQLFLPSCLIVCVTLNLGGCVHPANLNHDSSGQKFSTQVFNLKPLPGVAYKDISGQWWHLLHSQQLNRIIDQALVNNANLIAIKYAFDAAQQRVVSKNIALDAQFDLSRAHSPGLTIPGQSSTMTVFQPSLSLNYNLDLFGSTRNLTKVLQAQVSYQKFILINAYLELTANIAKTCIQLALLHDIINLTHTMIDTQKLQVKIIENKFKLGSTTFNEVITQKNALINLQAKLPELYQLRSEYNNLLVVLTGGTFNAKQRLSISLHDFNLPSVLPLSLASSVAQQRPDIRAAEALVHAASAKVGIATANLFPHLTLSANYGWAENELSKLFNPTNMVWNFSTQLLQPIFNSGALMAERRAALADFNQAAAVYRDTTIKAFAEISNVLQSITHNKQLVNDIATAQMFAAKNVKIADYQYRNGATSLARLLDYKIQYNNAQLQLLQAQAAQFNDAITLVRALGGGWWHRKDYLN